MRSLTLLSLLFLSSCTTVYKSDAPALVQREDTRSKVIISSGSLAVCPPWMYSDHNRWCVATHTACPLWQTLTGIVGTQFCEMDPDTRGNRSGSVDTPPQNKTVWSDATIDPIRAEYIRKLIKDNTEITWGHDPIPSRHYTMKTYTAVKKEVTQKDIPILKILQNDTDKFVRIGAKNALQELAISWTVIK